MAFEPEIDESLSGDQVCSFSSGGCGKAFEKGTRAYILTSRQMQEINAAEGDLPFSSFEHQNSIFCPDCNKLIDTAGGILAKHSQRGEYLVSFRWLMRRTLY